MKKEADSIIEIARRKAVSDGIEFHERITSGKVGLQYPPMVTIINSTL